MTQNSENHSRIVPAYHRVALPIFALNLLWSVYRAIRFFSMETLVPALLAVALVILFIYARVFAITAQDQIGRASCRERVYVLV